MTPEELERAIVAPADARGPRRRAAPPRRDDRRRRRPPRGASAPPVRAHRARRGATDGVLTLEAYRRIGGVSGALARRAEQLFEPMNETARDACRQLFLRLVTLGEGTEDTRRRVRRSELADARRRASDGRRDRDVRPPPSPLVRPGSRHSRAHRRDRSRGAAPRMGAAPELDRGRHGRNCGSRPGSPTATREWTQADRGADYLLAGIEARAGRGGRRRATPSGSPTPSGSISTRALRRRDAEAAAERERQQRENRLERRARTRLRGLVAVLAAATLVAASLTAVAVNRSREANRTERRGDRPRAHGGRALEPPDGSRSQSPARPAGGTICSADLGDARAGRDRRGSPLGDPGGRDPIPRADRPGRGGGESLRVPRGLRPAGVGPREPGTRSRGRTRNRSDVCERFFETESCPALPSRFSADLRSESLSGARPDTTTPARRDRGHTQPTDQPGWIGRRASRAPRVHRDDRHRRSTRRQPRPRELAGRGPRRGGSARRGRIGPARRRCFARPGRSSDGPGDLPRRRSSEEGTESLPGLARYASDPTVRGHRTTAACMASSTVSR